MIEIKLFGKSDDQTDSPKQIVFTFNEDMDMEISLNKCGVVILKKRTFAKFDGIVLPSKDIMKAF